MTIARFSVKGERQAIEALIGVSREAEFAQQSAMRAAGRTARSVAVKGFSGAAGVPQKLYRKRVQFFPRRKDRKQLASGRLWSGLKTPVRYHEHQAAARRLQSLYPRGFPVATRRGRTGWFERAGPPPAPLAERAIEVQTQAEALLLAAAKGAMRDVYVNTLRSDYLRRVRKRTGRR